MPATGIDIDQVININTSVQAALPRKEFGAGLLLTQSNKLDAGGLNKAKRFSRLSDVEDFFGEDDDVAKDAAVWFAADPKPKALYIGNWAKENRVTTIVSQSIAKTATEFAAVTNGSMKIGSNDITGITFAGDTSYADVASTLQTAIAAEFPGADVGYAGGKFTITFTTTTDPGPIGTVSSTPGTDLSNSEWLGIAEGGDGQVRVGSSAETVGQAVDRSVALASYGAPVALMVGRDVDANTAQSTTVKGAMRTYAQSGDYLFAAIESEAVVLNDTDTTSEMAKAKTTSSTKTSVLYSDSAGKRSDIAVMAALSGQNYALPNSLKTLVPKSLPGVEPSAVTEAQARAIEAKNGSVYTNVGGEPTLLGGRTGGGTWIDSQWWVTWLKSRMETAIFDAARTSNRLNNSILTATINEVMEEAVRSGGVRPGGRVSPAVKQDIIDVTNTPDFDGVLSAGYLLWVDNPNNQSAQQRGQRTANFRIWITPSEAIHTVDGTITLASG